ncbi:hypothetical protein OH77DRAFT_1424474 [Trametes cingulata]|nr:hypothetical protein OH77DRAFT_1424474 [Trametes cingulata]
MSSLLSPPLAVLPRSPSSPARRPLLLAVLFCSPSSSARRPLLLAVCSASPQVSLQSIHRRRPSRSILLVVDDLRRICTHTHTFLAMAPLYVPSHRHPVDSATDPRASTAVPHFSYTSRPPHRCPFPAHQRHPLAVQKDVHSRGRSPLHSGGCSSRESYRAVSTARCVAGMHSSSRSGSELVDVERGDDGLSSAIRPSGPAHSKRQARPNVKYVIFYSCLLVPPCLALRHVA